VKMTQAQRLGFLMLSRERPAQLGEWPIAPRARGAPFPIGGARRAATMFAAGGGK